MQAIDLIHQEIADEEAGLSSSPIKMSLPVGLFVLGIDAEVGVNDCLGEFREVGIVCVNGCPGETREIGSVGVNGCLGESMCDIVGGFVGGCFGAYGFTGVVGCVGICTIFSFEVGRNCVGGLVF